MTKLKFNPTIKIFGENVDCNTYDKIRSIVGRYDLKEALVNVELKVEAAVFLEWLSNEI